MVITVPTFKVIFAEGEGDHALYRVPETNLKAFLDVLLFNKIGTFTVERETPFGARVAQQFEEALDKQDDSAR